jgi:predicted N-formylglutamate amidohydrolase
VATSELPLLLTCEHAGNRLPPAERPLFRGRARWLASHRGWDPGALAAARALARASGAPLLATTFSRLLVDANRSAHNPAVFSVVTRHLPPEHRARLLERYHRPHWERVRKALRVAGARGRPVLHVAVHSFFPRWRGEQRRFEIGLLYDPQRRGERALAAAWKRRLGELDPGLRVRRNAPYRGAADGLTTALRRELPPSRYLGIELELGQAALAHPALRRRLLRALAALLQAPGVPPPRGESRRQRLGVSVPRARRSRGGTRHRSERPVASPRPGSAGGNPRRDPGARGAGSPAPPDRPARRRADRRRRPGTRCSAIGRS